MLFSTIHPRYPDATEIDDTYEKGYLHLKGFSSWSIGTTKCAISGQRKRSRTFHITLGLPEPQYCQLTNDACPAGIIDQKPLGERNVLFALVLGWCYILSARLIELRVVSGGDAISYTESQAPSVGKEDAVGNDKLTISIDSTDAAECRWWAAILAKGCGWQAVFRRGSDVYHTPWSCHLNQEEQIQIRHSLLTSDSSQLSPPSASQAREYLMSFAKRYNAYDQLLTAFAVSLTVPSHGRFGSAIYLPSPLVPTEICKTKYSPNSIPSIPQLPHFMALSCIGNILTPSVFGCFWEPKIECNLASEWLGPLLHECIPYLLKADQYHTIIHMMAERRPNSAPLWLGMWITGLMPRVLGLAGKVIMSISLEATHWVASSQSFMDPIFATARLVFEKRSMARLLSVARMKSDFCFSQTQNHAATHLHLYVHGCHSDG